MSHLGTVKLQIVLHHQHTVEASFTLLIRFWFSSLEAEPERSNTSIDGGSTSQALLSSRELLLSLDQRSL